MVFFLILLLERQSAIRSGYKVVFLFLQHCFDIQQIFLNLNDIFKLLSSLITATSESKSIILTSWSKPFPCGCKKMKVDKITCYICTYTSRNLQVRPLTVLTRRSTLCWCIPSLAVVTSHRV